jgi:hypothetical protein
MLNSEEPDRRSFVIGQRRPHVVRDHRSSISETNVSDIDRRDTGQPGLCELAVP